MKKNFLLFSLVGILLFAGTAQAESPTSKIVKAFDNFHKAKLYNLESDFSQKTTVKFFNKKDQVDFDKNEEKTKLLSSVTKNDVKVDNSDTDNNKLYASSHITGGLLDGTSVDTIKIGGYVYEKKVTKNNPEAVWVRSDNSVSQALESLIYSSASSTDKVSLIEFTVKNFSKKVTFKKIADGVVQNKKVEHYVLDMSASTAKSIFSAYMKKKGINATLANMITKSTNQLNKIRFDVWIEKGTYNLVQHNTLMTSSIKDKKSVATVNVLNEITYKSINEPLEIYAPEKFEISSSTSSK